MNKENVIDFESQKPHASGYLKCLDCGSISNNIVPIEINFAKLKCPDCGNYNTLFIDYGGHIILTGSMLK